MLVDSYGSPTAASDLQHFHDTFFPTLPEPNFQEVFPQGNPQYNNTCTNSKGKSGPCAAAGWSGEATLDIEWAYSIAPEANIVLLAVPPAETEGVQGLPALFKAMSGEIAATPPRTVFSMSFSTTEQDFGGAAASQTAKFDQVFQQGLAKNDNFFAATGDYGSQSDTKQAKNTNLSNYTAVGYPSTSHTSSPSAAPSCSTSGRGIRRATTRRRPDTGTGTPVLGAARPCGTSRGRQSGPAEARA